MQLFVRRIEQTDLVTIGRLSIDGKEFCWTLEDPVREKADLPVKAWKVYGNTAIPRGEYEVVVTYSQRFKKDLPLVVDVPGFQGIRIHPGNTTADTEGCILVGSGRAGDTILNSRSTFMKLIGKLDAAYDRGERIYITVE